MFGSYLLNNMRTLSFNRFLNSVTINSWDSLNVEATSPISVASTSGLRDISAMKEFKFLGSAGVFQLTEMIKKLKKMS